MTVRFHSLYTDAAGNQRAQFEFGNLRGEICFDKARGIVTIEEPSRNFSKAEIVDLKRAYRKHCGLKEEG